MRRFIKKLKNSIIGKILKAIFKILIWAAELMIIFIAIIIVTQRVTNNEKAFLGFRIFNVATGSMEPEYAVGDILIAREKDPSTIKVDDNIVYLGNTADYAGKIITHNVIEVEQDENGDYLFHTKGIANTVEDPIVHEDQLFGIVVQNNRVLAFICKILLNKYGLYFFVMIPIILYAFVGFVRAQGERIEHEREEEYKRKQLEKERREQRKKMKESKVQEETQEESDEEVQIPKKKTVKKEHSAENVEETEAKSKNKKTTSKKVEATEKKTTTKKTKKVEETEIPDKTPKKTATRKKAKEE